MADKKPQLTQQKSVNSDKLDPEAVGFQTPLSERPMIVATDTSFVDKLELLKESHKTEDEVKKTKQVALVIVDTNAIINFGLKNSKQQQNIQNELKALLDHEQKIIQQIFERAQKFKEFKDESKKSADEFEDEHNSRIPLYAQFLKQLAEIPETQNVTQEGMPKAVQAKILYNIVENTTHAANNTIVQLSMEKTLMNDMDLSMEKLRNFSTFMQTNYQIWSKDIGSQEKNLAQIIATYNKLKDDVNNLNGADNLSEADSEGVKTEELADVMRSIDDRLKALESELKTIKCQTACSERLCISPADFPRRKPAVCKLPENYCDPQQDPRQNLPRMDDYERSNPSLSRRRSSQDRLHAGRDQYNSPSSPTVRCSQVECSPYYPEFPKVCNQKLKPQSLNIRESCPQLYSRSWHEDSYLDDNLTPDSLEISQRQQGIQNISSNCMTCPQLQSEKVRNSPEGLFRPHYQPPSKSPSKIFRGKSVETLQQTEVEVFNWSPIQPEYKLDFVEVTGVRGRPKVPYSPLHPGELPMTSQDELKDLSHKNNNLKDLFDNLRQMRMLLMEEMDKALRLNQKVQKDLNKFMQDEEQQKPH